MYRPHSRQLVIICFLTILLMLLGPFVGAIGVINEDFSSANPNSNYTTNPTLISQQELVPLQNDIIVESEKLNTNKQLDGASNSKTNAFTNTNSGKLTIPLYFQPPQIMVEEGYTQLEMVDCIATGKPGEPELPEKILSFKFEPGTTFQKFEFTPGSIVTDIITQPIQPIQEPIPVSELDLYSYPVPEPTPPNADIYSNPKLFPRHWIEINKGIGLDLESRESTLFVTAKIFPVKYLPTQNLIMYTNEGKLTIDYTPPEPSSKSNSNNDNNMKPHVVGSDASPPAIDESYKILIIGPDLFRQNLSRLAVYKNTTGLPAKFVSITEIKSDKYFPQQGSDDQEKIKYFIKNALDNWSITYVILGGDTPQVPHRNGYIHGEEGNTPSDLYYADIYKVENDNIIFDDWDYDNDGVYGEYDNGNVDRIDLYADVIIGRLPASTNGQLELLVDRIINYESFTAGQTWFDNVTMCGTNTFDTSGTDLPEGEFACENIDSLYLEDFVTTKIYETTYYNRDLSCTSTNIVNTLNKGSGFATFHDHGAPTSWAGVFTNSHASSLTNGDKLPFMNFDACSTGYFDRGSGDSITEVVLLNSNGGAITSIGASRLGYGQYHEAHITRYSGYFNTQLYSNYYNGEGTAGRVFHGAKNDYLNNKVISNFADFKTIIEFNLFGDPSLSLGGIPLKNINITCDDNTSYVAPSESAQYELTVTNNGTISRPIKLYLTGIPTQWSAALNESLVVVPAKGEKKVTLTVNASETAIFQQIADVEVYAYYSKNKDRTISVNTKTITTRIYGMDLYTTSLEDSVYPGEEASYWLKITNLGNAQDTINLEANLSEPLNDWIFDFSAVDVILQPFSYEIVTLNVSPPLKTIHGDYVINVSGKIFNYVGDKSEDFVNYGISILRTYGLSLSTDEELSKAYYPGEKFTYHINVENKGNYWDNFQFALLMYPKAWEISLSQIQAFKVEAFTTRVEELKIEIPNHTVVGQNTIKLRAQSKSNHTIIDDIMIIIRVNRTYGVELLLDQYQATGDPGETIEFNLSIQHLGNDIDEVEFSLVDFPAKWYYNLTDSISVEPYGNYYVNFQVVPYLYAVTGSFPFKLEVTLVGNQAIKYVDMNITVNPIDGFEIICDEDSYNIDAGSIQKYSFTIKNTGNHDDEISLDITNVPDNWSVNWTNTRGNSVNKTIHLGPFESMSNIQVRISTYSKSIAGTYGMMVSGTLSSTEDVAEIPLLLTINPYYGVKLELDSEDSSITIHPDKEFIITINITNEGNSRDNISRNITGLPSTWKILTPKHYIYVLEPFERRREDIRISLREDEAEREVNITIRVASEGNPNEEEQEKSYVYVEHEPEPDIKEDTDRWTWDNLDRIFIHWILPVLLLIIVAIIILFLLVRQRKEYKEEERAIREMERGEYDEDYDYEAEQLYGPEYVRGQGRGDGYPMPPPPPPHRRTLKPRTKSFRTSKTTAIKKDKMRWLDEDRDRKHDILGVGGAGTRSRRDITLDECPGCGELIGIDEYKCPYCGEIIEDLEERKPEPEDEDDWEEDQELVEDDEDWAEELEEEPEDLSEEMEADWEEEVDEDTDDLEELELDEVEVEEEGGEEEEEDIDWDLEE